MSADLDGLDLLRRLAALALLAGRLELALAAAAELARLTLAPAAPEGGR